VFVKIRSGDKRASSGNERGSSSLELALVMPILMLILLGLASFGLTLHDLLVLTNGVNAGAQLLSMSRGQTTDPCSTASSAISSAAPSLTTGLSLTFVINGTTYAATTSCPAGVSNMVQGATAQITATYPCTLTVFGVLSPTCSLQARTAESIQ
jgi:Flp pilus assembly protein TadG